MKLIIKPQYIDWDQARAMATKLGGRMLTYKEMTRWSNNEAVEIDIWIDQKMDDRGQYFDAKKQDIRFKYRNEKCLLVMLVDPKRIKKLKEAHLADSERKEQMRRRLKRLRKA